MLTKYKTVQRRRIVWTGWSVAATQKHEGTAVEQVTQLRELKPMVDWKDRDVKKEHRTHSWQADTMLPLKEALDSRRED